LNIVYKEAMFTGLIEEVGEIRVVLPRGKNRELAIRCPLISQESKKGDSLAVNGVCLTITEVETPIVRLIATEETLRRTNLRGVRRSDFVNLERALSASGRFGGHLITGHIDGVGEVTGLKPKGENLGVRIDYPPEMDQYLVPQGSVAVEGISFTVLALKPYTLELMVIPFTLKATNFKYLSLSNRVNIECDLIAKYLEKLLITGREATKEGITRELLSKYGFLPGD